ncbi:16S rRNA (cytidine(1402)-2'-O)-methyltransferase [Aerococcus viridans]|uniref:16S rRNA (cytidine(1402)-2'-O)-methyltransferase n=1 Tax=Aerococcus urinaeequi TaxID=51665 RepID=UPI003AC888F9
MVQVQHSFTKQENEGFGTLYLVPTPIGNLEDMTFRAVNTLKSVDMILAEDTRNTQKLLNHFEVTTGQMSYHQHNSQTRIPQILAMLKEGQSLAQVSDAGMPAISDPGFELAQAAIAEGIRVVPLPGANAALTGLVASGLDTDQFTFIGFLPRKKSEKKAFLDGLVNFPYTMMFYESPYRLVQTLEDCRDAFGPDRPAVVVRELTKKFEEFNRGSLDDLAVHFDQNGPIKGEICFYISGNDAPVTEATMLQDALEEISLKDQVDWWMGQKDLSTKDAIKQVAKQTGVNKRDVYAAYHEI